ncbi:ATP-binding protein [Actinoplanes sp. TFC3]|uniref:ATP-binding protein n=1 Tax=Actinoplanes sp. TFC3 TaxID=1710355 RepID=UPI0008326D34|nr:ATP-binding protein [Actinoplanes sp. TFC3]
MTLESLVQDDDGRLLVQVRGNLSMQEVSGLHVRLMKCLAEQPEALLIDISGMRVLDPLALAVFPAVVRQAAQWPGISVLLCGSSDDTRHVLQAAAYRRVPVLKNVEQARERVADERESLPTLTDELLPLSGAARQARNVATDACLRWDLPDLVAPASLIASELVSNVVDHAHTMMNLRLTLTRRYLQISVRDGSAEEPLLSRNESPDATGGRGLMLVDATAHAWGWLPCSGGKVTWASLRV